MANAPVVMIVDDSDDMRDLFRDLLACEVACTVVDACDGRAAIEVLEQADAAAPSLIVLDWSMPVMGGDAVLRWLKQDVRFSEIPVIVWTATPGVEAPGALLILQKPADLDLLVELVRKCCTEGEGRATFTWTEAAPCVATAGAAA